MRLKEVDQRLMQQLGVSWDSDLGARQEPDFAGSMVTGGASPAVHTSDRPRAARSFPRHVGGHGGRLQLSAANSAGLATPLMGSRLAGSNQAVQVSPASFAFQRVPSIGNRNTSAYTFTVMGSNRNASIPSTAAHLVQRVQQGRSPPNNQSHASKPACAVDAFPSLFESAPVTEDSLAQGLEALPAFGGDVDLPIGGDLTVILRYVEGLSAGLSNNENVFAVEAKVWYADLQF